MFKAIITNYKILILIGNLTPFLIGCMEFHKKNYPDAFLWFIVSLYCKQKD